MKIKNICFSFILFLCLIGLSFFAFACTKDEPVEGEVQISSISADSSLVSDNVSLFKLSDIKLTVNYTNGESEVKDVTLDMVSKDEVSLIKKPGSYLININYEGFSDFVTLTFTSQNETVVVRFIVDGEVMEKVIAPSGGSIIDIPLVPKKEGYKGTWSQSGLSKLYQNVDVYAIYTYIEPKTEDEEREFFSEIENYLDGLYEGIAITSNIDFVYEYEEYSISWESSNEEILTNEGVFKKPYDATTLSLTASIKGLHSNFSKTYNYDFIQYKSLDGNICSGYLYRSYQNTTDALFDTLDIIYCAFIPIDVDGGFTGTNATGGNCSSEFSRVIINIKNYLMPRAREKGVYVVPSLGGGGSSPAQTFSEIAKDGSKRVAFANNIVELINKYDFDGIDIDWELPTADEIRNFTLMMKEIYTKVKANNPNHIVTAAICGGMWQPPRYDLNNSVQYLDYINMMTYAMDMGAGRYHNALYASTSPNDKTNNCGYTLQSCSIDESVKIYNSYNIPNSKIIVGLAFYATSQSKETGSWVAAGSIYYDTVKERMESDEYTYVYDTKAGVPYLISKDGLTFLSFDDPRSIKEKIEYCKTKGLAGVMYWENGLDGTGDLLLAMKEGYNK